MHASISAVIPKPELGWLYANPHVGSAISREATLGRFAATVVVRAMERSQALFGLKAISISQLWMLRNDCAEQGWDGEDAMPLNVLAVYQTIKFIRALPASMPLPEFAAVPDGSVSLDWIKSRSRIFSISIGTSSRLAFAWLDGADKGHAVARFDEGNGVPKRIIDGITSIVGT